MPRTFTGRHMTMVLVAFFGTIIVVNFTMARFASSTFGGVVVENSYVASQHFNLAQELLHLHFVVGFYPFPNQAQGITISY